MITKSKFIKYMSSIVSLDESLSNTVSTLEELEICAIGLLCDLSGTEIMIEMLEDLIDDTNNWISYFVFECSSNFQLFNNGVTVYGEHPDLKDYGDLYDFIINWKL